MTRVERPEGQKEFFSFRNVMTEKEFMSAIHIMRVRVVSTWVS